MLIKSWGLCLKTESLKSNLTGSIMQVLEGGAERQQVATAPNYFQIISIFI